MTSTSFNVGLKEDSRLSSRVLRPPGGGHTDIFGGEAEAPQIQRRGPPPSSITFGQDEPAKTNGRAPAQNGNAQTPEPAQPVETPASTPDAPKPEAAKPEPARAEPAKRVRVPPGGFSSVHSDQATGQQQSRRGMEGGGRQSRLLTRLLGKLRGETKLGASEKVYQFTPTVLTVKPSLAGSATMTEPSMSRSTCSETDEVHPRVCSNASTMLDDEHLGNIDLRYGGQYLTPEQLPQFCDQLHNLVEVIRNIQSYATVTGEYPRELERRLEHEAREVAALAAEARNARDVTVRVRAQRRALRKHRDHVRTQLTKLKDAGDNLTEVRELESSVRLSDRKLYKSWEALKDTSDPAAFDPLVEEIKNKQVALDCLLRLIDNKKSSIARQPLKPTPLPPPEPKENNDESSTVSAMGRRRRKRRRRSPRSAPLSEEPSRHAPPAPPAPPAPAQVTLYIQGSESTSRYRVGSAGAVALTPLELPSGGSVRDILFFSTNN